MSEPQDIQAILSEIFAEAQSHSKATQLDFEADIREQFGIGVRVKPGGAPIPEKFEVGNFSHEYAERLIPEKKLPRGLDPEVTIDLPDGSKKRMDRVDWKKGVIYEIKPDTPSQIEKGKKQVKLYEEYMNRREKLLGKGRRWKGVVVTYNKKNVIQFLRERGWLPDKSTRRKSTRLRGTQQISQPTQTKQNIFDESVGEPRRATNNSATSDLSRGTTRTYAQNVNRGIAPTQPNNQPSTISPTGSVPRAKQSRFKMIPGTKGAAMGFAFSIIQGYIADKAAAIQGKRISESNREYRLLRRFREDNT
jgi:Restriction endonuclease fold toxin 9